MIAYFLFYIISLALFAITTKDKKLIVAYFPLICIIFDITVMHSVRVQGVSTIATYRGMITLLLLIFLWIKYVKLEKYFTPLLIYIFYLCFLFLIKSPSINSYLASFSHILKINISICLYPLAYYTIRDLKYLKKLNDALVLTLAIFIIYILVVNIFNIGQNMYVNIDGDSYGTRGVINSGMLGGNSANILAYIILLIPLINVTIHRKFKIVKNILFISAIIILALILRRSSIIIVIMGYLIYLFSIKNKPIYYKYIALIPIIFILTWPIYGDFLMNAIYLRGIETFQVEIVESEKRTIESTFILAKAISFQDPIYSLFGGNILTNPNIPGTSLYRSLHSDYTVIVHKSGLIGLVLYLLILIAIIKHYYSLKKLHYNDLLSTVFWILILTSSALAYPGRFTSITFRSIVFLYLGSILGIMKMGGADDTY